MYGLCDGKDGCYRARDIDCFNASKEYVSKSTECINVGGDYHHQRHSNPSHVPPSYHVILAHTQAITFCQPNPTILKVKVYMPLHDSYRYMKS